MVWGIAAGAPGRRALQRNAEDGVPYRGIRIRRGFCEECGIAAGAVGDCIDW